MAVSAVTHNHLATHTQLHIHAYMDTQIDTRTQTYTHTYTHAHNLPLPLSVCLISLSLSASLSLTHTHSFTGILTGTFPLHHNLCACMCERVCTRGSMRPCLGVSAMTADDFGIAAVRECV